MNTSKVSDIKERQSQTSQYMHNTGNTYLSNFIKKKGGNKCDLALVRFLVSLAWIDAHSLDL